MGLLFKNFHLRFSSSNRLVSVNKTLKNTSQKVKDISAPYFFSPMKAQALKL